MFCSITELVLPSNCTQFACGVPQRSGNLTGDCIGTRSAEKSRLCAAPNVSTRPGPGSVPLSPNPLDFNRSKHALRRVMALVADMGVPCCEASATVDGTA